MMCLSRAQSYLFWFWCLYLWLMPHLTPWAISSRIIFQIHLALLVIPSLAYEWEQRDQSWVYFLVTQLPCANKETQMGSACGNPNTEDWKECLLRIENSSVARCSLSAWSAVAPPVACIVWVTHLALITSCLGLLVTFACICFFFPAAPPPAVPTQVFLHSDSSTVLFVGSKLNFFNNYEMMTFSLFW